MKRVIAFLAVLVLMMALVSTFSVGISATDADSTAISNAEELLALIEPFEKGSFKGTYHLTNDIDLGGKAFKQYVFKHFNGTLDGKGFKIYNFSFDGTNDIAANAGFFQYLGNSADTTVKNLQIGDETTPIEYKFSVADKSRCYSFLASETGNNNANTSVTIENVDIYANANVVASNAKPKFNFGGLIGLIRAKANAYVIKDCTINGEINVCVELNGGGNYMNGAGFIACSQSTASLVMENCVNNANVTTGFSTKEARASGFVAYSAQKTITFTKCVNTGNITVLGDTAGAEAAGFVSDINCSAVELVECINAGDISGCQYAAGFVAKIRNGKSATLTKCTNYGEVSESATAHSIDVAFNQGTGVVNIVDFVDRTGLNYDPNPFTGDNVMSTIICMALSFAGIVVLVSLKKKKAID